MHRNAKHLPPVTLVAHGSSSLAEASNVGASDQAGELALRSGHELLGGLEAVGEAVLHDVLELAVNLLSSPGDALAVLRHLKTRDRDTTSVGGLAGSVPDGLALLLAAVGLEGVDGLLGAAHVGALGDELAACLDKVLGLVAGDLVLGRRGEGDVDLTGVHPGALTSDVVELVLVLGALGKLGELLAADLEVGDVVDEIGRDAGLVGGDEGTLAVGEGDDGAAKLDDLESGVLGDVAGAGDGDALALEGLLAAGGVLDHVLDVVDSAVAGGLRPDQAATPGAALTGENTLPLVGESAVGAEHVANLAASDTNVTSGNVGLGADVLVKLAHERAAEAADLAVALVLGVEVGATLAATHAEAGQGVLEDLLETEEFEDTQVDGGVKAEATLVGAEGGVELDSEGIVDLDLALVVLPNNAELDDALGDGDDLEGVAVLGVLLEERAVLEGGGKLWKGMEISL